MLTTVDEKIRLSVSLMTHPIRESYVPPLLKRLGAERFVKVSNDTESEGIWSNAMNAWRLYDSDATHHMVLQDDIIPSKDFLLHVPRLIQIVEQFRPDSSMSFCGNLNMPMKLSDAYAKPWVAAQIVRHAQALLQPVSQIEDFIKWSEYHVRPEFYHDDGRLELYLREHDKWCFHTVPSLVEHDDDGSVKTKLKGRSKKSKPYTSYRFIGEDRSPAEIDWEYGYTFFPTPPSIFHDWAIGKIQTLPEGPRDYGKNPVMKFPTSYEPYDDIMEIARLERGVSQ